jgi:hypothetical protein
MDHNGAASIVPIAGAGRPLRHERNHALGAVEPVTACRAKPRCRSQRRSRTLSLPDTRDHGAVLAFHARASTNTGVDPRSPPVPPVAQGKGVHAPACRPLNIGLRTPEIEAQTADADELVAGVPRAGLFGVRLSMDHRTDETEPREASSNPGRRARARRRRARPGGVRASAFERAGVLGEHPPRGKGHQQDIRGGSNRWPRIPRAAGIRRTA